MRRTNVGKLVTAVVTLAPALVVLMLMFLYELRSSFPERKPVVYQIKAKKSYFVFHLFSPGLLKMLLQSFPNSTAFALKIKRRKNICSYPCLPIQGDIPTNIANAGFDAIKPDIYSLRTSPTDDKASSKNPGKSFPPRPTRFRLVGNRGASAKKIQCVTHCNGILGLDPLIRIQKSDAVRPHISTMHLLKHRGSRK